MRPERRPNESKLRPEALARSVSFGEERNGKTRVTRPGTSPTSPEKKMYPLTSPRLTKRVLKTTPRKAYVGGDSSPARQKAKPKAKKNKNFDSPSPRAAPGAPKKARKFVNFNTVQLRRVSFPAAAPDHYISDSSSGSDTTETDADTSSESSSGSDTTETDDDTSSESSSGSDTTKTDEDTSSESSSSSDTTETDDDTSSESGSSSDTTETDEDTSSESSSSDTTETDEDTSSESSSSSDAPDAITRASGNVGGIAKGIDGTRRKKKAKKNEAEQKKRGVVKKGVVRRQRLPAIPPSELAKRRATRSAKGTRFFSLP